MRLMLTTNILDPQRYEWQELLTVVVERDLTLTKLDAQVYEELYETAKDKLSSRAQIELADGVMGLQFTPQIVYQNGQASQILLHATGMLFKDTAPY